ncbi:MAG: hypothetical protein FWC64_02470 [Treponema sp.]|nr:hypothetical protein [Treponema sp.]
MSGLAGQDDKTRQNKIRQGKTRSLPARFFNETILRSPSISRRVKTTATQEKTPSAPCLLNVYVLPGLFQ